MVVNLAESDEQGEEDGDGKENVEHGRQPVA